MARRPGLTVCLAALIVALPLSPRDGPPFPGTRDPQLILANLITAIREAGFPGRIALMADEPRIRRLLEVQDDVDQRDFWLLELENTSGTYLGIAAIDRAGRFKQLGASDGVTEPEPTAFVADLARVQSTLGPWYGASRARYVVGLTTIDSYQLYFPTIAADSVRGTIFVNRRLDVFRETQRIARAQRTDEARFGLGVPSIGKHVYVTRERDLLVLEALGNIKHEVEAAAR